MNEFLRNFIMTGIRDMIKNGVVLYQTYQYASGWFSKGILNQEDLEEIQKLYEEKMIVEEKDEEISIECNGITKEFDIDENNEQSIKENEETMEVAE